MSEAEVIGNQEDPGATIRTVGLVLVITASVYIVFLLLGISLFGLRLAQSVEDRGFNVNLVINCSIPLIFNCLLVWGAMCMIRRTSYMWSFAACCLALFPLCGPMYVLGIPIGIWGLVLLVKPEVRDSFQYM